MNTDLEPGRLARHHRAGSQGARLVLRGGASRRWRRFRWCVTTGEPGCSQRQAKRSRGQTNDVSIIAGPNAQDASPLWSDGSPIVAERGATPARSHHRAIRRCCSRPHGRRVQRPDRDFVTWAMLIGVRILRHQLSGECRDGGEANPPKGRLLQTPTLDSARVRHDTVQAGQRQQPGHLPRQGLSSRIESEQPKKGTCTPLEGSAYKYPIVFSQSVNEE